MKRARAWQGASGFGHIRATGPERARALAVAYFVACKDVDGKQCTVIGSFLLQSAAQEAIAGIAGAVVMTTRTKLAPGTRAHHHSGHAWAFNKAAVDGG